MTPFDQAFALLIGEEGGYVNNKADPGGETKYGISRRQYPMVDIAGMTLDGARAIYRRDYWTPTGCDRLPPPVALMVFDGAVNSGNGTSVKWLQRALQTVADGAMGPGTLTALAGYKGGTEALLAEMLAQRIFYLASLPGWGVFGLGWARRMGRLPFHALGMNHE